MKIIKLTAENIKRLKAIEIEPQHNTVILSGKNAQGKTSVLDCIEMAITGCDTKKNSQPIRNGQTKANVTLELDNLVITRNWTGNDKSYLKVESKEGAKYSSPQKLLDDLVGKLSFDPLAFVQMDSKKQVETLLSIIDLKIDPKEIDAKKKTLFDERTIVNREIKGFNAQLEAMPAVDTNVPDKELEVSDILENIQEANKVITANNEKKNELTKLHEAYLALKKRKVEIEVKISELQQSLNETEADLEKMSEDGKRLKTEVEVLVNPDTTIYTNQLKDLQEINKKVRLKQQYYSINEQLLLKEQEAEKLTTFIEDLEKSKTEALADAKFPIKGLGFSEGGVVYNNVPFTQCSSAEQLKVSLAMAMAMNPKLRVIRISDGSLLDSDNMQVIEMMAEKFDFQVWIEKVDESGNLGIMIEDGEIRINNEIPSADSATFNLEPATKAPKKRSSKVSTDTNPMFG